MKRFSLIFMTVFSIFLIAACDEKKGAPLPKHQDGLQLAEKSGWQAELTWDQSPRFSDEEFMEMRGIILFADENGNLASSVEGVSLVADMPQHGHGTGNIQPIVSPFGEVPSKFRFENLYRRPASLRAA